MGSSPSINLPPQASYSEAMADSLKAQVDLLRGSGEFADTGGLKSLLETYEAPLRKSTAQTDTDILRQTLQGDESFRQADELGRVIQGYTEAGPDVVTIENEADQYEQYVRNNPDLLSSFNNPQGDFEQQSASQGIAAFGKAHYQKFGAAENRTLPEIGKSYNPDGSEFARQAIMSEEGAYTPGQIVRQGTGMVDLLGDSRRLTGQNRAAGFDEKGRFLGLSALTEDIGAEQQTRSRERDLADVERLAGRYKDVMDKFKDENIMTSIGEVGGPSDVFANEMIEQRTPDGGERRVGTVDPMAQAVAQPAQAQPMQGQPATDPMIAQIAQTGTPVGAGLRETLTNEALLGLGQGLTDRERRNIEQASRARATTLGRTFDVGSVEDEVTAKLLEDRSRLNQNRAFAQSVLGQEGGLRMQELALQQRNKLDPFQAILGRSGGSTVGQAQNILGGAGYGLQSGPAYLNPQAGINYTSQAYANQAGLEAARMNAQASRTAGIFQGLGSLGGGLLSGGYLPGGNT